MTAEPFGLLGTLIERIEQAFKAGYHCRWHKDQGFYCFDPAMSPGDPDGAFKAWLAALHPVPPQAQERLTDVVERYTKHWQPTLRAEFIAELLAASPPAQAQEPAKHQPSTCKRCGEPSHGRIYCSNACWMAEAEAGR